MRDYAFAIDFYRKLTTIVFKKHHILKKRKNFHIFPLSLFLEQCKLICFRKVIKNVVAAKDLYNGF